MRMEEENICKEGRGLERGMSVYAMKIFLEEILWKGRENAHLTI